MSETTPPPDPKSLVVVALGASAGGLRPLETFFEAIADDTGAAFVVIQHLSPDFESMMEQLLGRRTKMPVVQATNGMSIAANHVFLIPRRKEIRLGDAKLWLTDRPDTATEMSMPIDVFFKSMALAQGSRCIALLLSGAGSDGARGVQAVHRSGGLVAVQAPGTAQFDLMPKAAIATHDVDEVLTPEQMPAWVEEHIPLVGNRGEYDDGDDSIDPDVMQRIARLIRQRHGVDFTVYKRMTLGRRIERRRVACGCATVEEYAALLTLDEGEIDGLFSDLLIGVSAFFRDEEAFEALSEKVVPGLFEGRDADEPLRAWVAGCSTGEEAYSMGMLLHEAARTRGFPVDSIKVFATDVHPDYLLRAGRGDYTPEQFGPVPAELRDRYFTFNEGTGRYQVRTSLRSTIVFARHDLLNDPPFTRIDLVSCRNVLIYLRAHAQHRVLERLLTSLVPGGWLFLGPSESVGPLERLLDVVDRRERLFRARGGVLRPFTTEPPEIVTRLPLSSPVTWAAGSDGPGYLQLVYQQVLDRFVPACVLLDANMHVAHVFGDASRFLEVGPGRAGLDVMRIIRPTMRGALAAALQRCRDLGEAVVHRAIATGDEERPIIDLRVEQLSTQPGVARRYTVVGFVESLQPATEVGAPTEGEPVDRQLYAGLRAELDFTREHLSATTEELTASNEELQATNEELLAANEELQSTNEELQSTNEELYTVNAEFRRKNNELSQLNIDVDNLLKSSDIGAVFVDMALRVRKFTPAAAQLLNLLSHDVGRPFAHLAPSVGGVNLADRVGEVLETGHQWSQEWTLEDGRVILVRCLLNMDEGDVFDGAVVSFTDVTPVAQARSAQRASEGRLALFAEHVPFILWLGDARSGGYVFVSKSFERIWGRPVGALASVIPSTMRLVHPDDRAIYGDHLERMATGVLGEVEYRVQREDGREIWLRTRSFPIADSAQATFGGLTEDITVARNHAQVVETLQREKERLASLRDVVLESTPDGIAMFERNGALVFSNGAFRRLVDLEEGAEATYRDLLPDGRIGGLRRAVADAVRQNRPARGELQVRFGSRLSTFDYSVDPVRDARWRASHVVLILRDIGERITLGSRSGEEHLRALLAELRGALGGDDVSDAVHELVGRFEDALEPNDDVGEGPTDLAALGWAFEGPAVRGLPVSARLLPILPTARVNVELEHDQARRLFSLLFEHVLADDGVQAISRVRLRVDGRVPPPDIHRMSRPVLAADDEAMVCVEVADDGAGRERGLIKGVLSAKGVDPTFDELAALVEPHGGAVELRSVLGSGTTRRVWLPASPGTVLERTPHPATVVLIADDNEDARAAAAKELGPHFGVEEAVDGLATLRRFRTAAVPISALVLDLEMPGPSARAVFRETRALSPGLPVVLISAYPDDLDDAGIPADDACVALVKPWPANALRETIERLLKAPGDA